jgi:flagellar biosynthetic protein FliO
MLSTTVALVFVCALAVGVLKLLGRRQGGDGGMRVVGRLPLDARRSVYMVEVGGRCLLLGAGDGPLTLLTEIDKRPRLVEEEAA